MVCVEGDDDENKRPLVRSRSRSPQRSSFFFFWLIRQHSNNQHLVPSTTRKVKKRIQKWNQEQLFDSSQLRRRQMSRSLNRPRPILSLLLYASPTLAHTHTYTLSKFYLYFLVLFCFLFHAQILFYFRILIFIFFFFRWLILLPLFKCCSDEIPNFMTYSYIFFSVGFIMSLSHLFLLLIFFFDLVDKIW